MKTFNEVAKDVDKWCATQIQNSKIQKDKKSYKSLKSFRKIHQNILKEVTQAQNIVSDEEADEMEEIRSNLNLVNKNKLMKSNINPPIKLARSDVLKALKLLDNPKTNEKTQKLRDFCTKSKKVYKPDLTLWDSAIYLMKCIRQCVIKQEWKQIPELLLILMNYPKIYTSFVKEISYLTFLACCDNTLNQHILDDFRDLCFVNVNKIPNMNVNEFNVWYKD